MTVFTPRTVSDPPVVLYVHGGGWIGGDPLADSHFTEVRDRLLVRGVAVATIEYRLAPAFVFPAQIEDVQCARRYLSRHGGDLGVNGTRVAAWGASAGGHLVSLEAAREPEAFIAVVDWYGPADLDTVPADSWLGGVVGHVFGATPGSHDPRLATASPVRVARAGMPPFLIVHGDSDTTVDFQQSSDFAAALLAKNDRVTLLRVSHADHGLVPLEGGGPSIQDAVDRTVTFLTTALT